MSSYSQIPEPEITQNDNFGNTSSNNNDDHSPQYPPIADSSPNLDPDSQTTLSKQELTSSGTNFNGGGTGFGVDDTVAISSSSSNTNIRWVYTQAFGDDSSSSDDLVTALSFSCNGDYIAVGDKAGRLCIFKEQENPWNPTNFLRRAPRHFPGHEYVFYTEFQSHESEFDCLKSTEIEERLNAIRWLKPSNNKLMILATNDKTIKLWKVTERTDWSSIPTPSSFVFDQTTYEETTARNKDFNDTAYDDENNYPEAHVDYGENELAHNSTPNALKTRKILGRSFNTISTDNIVIPSRPYNPEKAYVTTAFRRGIFANGHTYHINSISNCSDGETFISADDVRINLWHLEYMKEVFSIIELKPTNMDEISEAITCASFHPTDCNLIIYGTSRGCVRVADMRINAVCDSHARVYETEDDPMSKTFFSEILNCVSDAIFSPDNHTIISRDFLKLKIWDARMERVPVNSVDVHEHLNMHLATLYDNDLIFDKFNVSCSKDGSQVVTGTYNNSFVVYDIKSDTLNTVDASPKPSGSLRNTKRKTNKTSKKSGATRKSTKSLTLEDIGTTEFKRRSLHVSWHPSMNCITTTAKHKLYVYHGEEFEDIESKK